MATSSEHIAQAIYHLKKAANANYDHLLFEQRRVDWTRETLSAARASAAITLLQEIDEVRTASPELWAVPDIRHRGDSDGQELMDR